VSEVAEPVSSPRFYPALTNCVASMVRVAGRTGRAFARTLIQLVAGRVRSPARHRPRAHGPGQWASPITSMTIRSGKARPWPAGYRTLHPVGPADWKVIEASGDPARPCWPTCCCVTFYGPPAADPRKRVGRRIWSPAIPNSCARSAASAPARRWSMSHLLLRRSGRAGPRRRMGRVMASRVDGPRRRLGYALEKPPGGVHKTFPRKFSGDMRVARLAAFFNAYRESILEMGASRRDPQRRAADTQGLTTKPIFEHALSPPIIWG